MKVAIIGAGNVGTALGNQLTLLKHEVIYGVRIGSSEKKKDLKCMPNYLAVAEAEVVLLTVPWAAAKEAATQIPDWKGKILVDCTNPIKQDFSGLEVGHTTSGGELVQEWAKGARVVKCFNQTGFENMANTRFGSKPCMYAAGNDASAVKTVADLARGMGFESIELPKLEMARQLEQLAWLWIYTAFKTPVGRQFAFGMLRK